MESSFIQLNLGLSASTSTKTRMDGNNLEFGGNNALYRAESRDNKEERGDPWQVASFGASQREGFSIRFLD
jgi:hypothetical protein